jgi:hypothetical protein
METFIPKDRVYTLLLSEIGPDSPEQGISGGKVTIDDPGAMQDLTTAYITTMYYSALSNLYFQGLLPKDRADIDGEMPRFKIAFNRTYADFTAAAEWLVKNGSTFIETSPAKQYYDEVCAIDRSSILDIPAAYSLSK